jgi:resuscitation-promoting factor RpfB
MPEHRKAPPRRRAPAPRNPSPPVILGALAATLATLVLLGVIAFAATRRPLTVILSVNGVTRLVQTHAGTVGELLAREGVAPAPGARVQPDLRMRLRPGSRVSVDEGRAIRVRLGGKTIVVRTHALTAAEIVQAAGVTLNPGDRVVVNGRPWPLDRPLAQRNPVVQLAGGPGRSVPFPAEAPAPPTAGDGDPLDDEGPPSLVVYQAVPVTVVEDGVPYPMEVAGATVGEALFATNLGLLPGDRLVPPAATPLVAEMRIEITRGTPFTLVVDGAERPVRAVAATVGAALPLSGIDMGPDDYPIPGPETALRPDMRVKLVRVEQRVETRAVEVPFARDERPNPDTDLDQVTVLQAGVPGQKRQTVRLTYHNGRVADTKVLAEQVLQEPVTEIVTYGTRVVWRTIDTEQGPKQYWRKLQVYATSYSLSRSGSSPNAPWYGRTRMGLQMGKGIIAVDPKIIPLGMWLYVPGYGVGIAGDTGGGVKGYHVDLGFDDDNYEGWHWPVDVYILERLPPEHQMRWILPPGRPRPGGR